MTTIQVYVGNNKYEDFDLDRLQDLIKEHRQAIKDNKNEFTFEDIVFQVSFANYVIEFVKSQLIK